MAEASTFSLKRMLEALIRQRYVFLSVFFTVLALGAVYIFGSHKKYASRMELLVQNARSEQVITAGRSEAPATAAEVSEEEINSEIELLQSADVLDEVIDPGWSKTSPSQRPLDEQQRHEGAVGSLQDNLAVTPIRKSHVISVQLVSRDPHQSTLVLKKLLDVFLQKKLQINHPAGASQLFDQEAERYRLQWQRAEQALSSFQQQNGIVSITEQEGGLQKQLFDADTQLRDANVEISELTHKVTADNDQLQALPSRRPTHETAIPASGSIDQLRTRLSELNLSRTELVSKYKPGDRLILQVDEQIAQVEATLKNMNGSYYAETSTDINPTWQAVEQDLSSTRTRLEGVSGRRHELADQITRLNSRLGNTEEQTQELNALQRRVAETEANYQVYAQKRDESHMTDVLDEHQLLNVAVAQAPTFSLSPVRPRPKKDGLLTFLTAVFLGGFGVFLVENSRSTIADDSELEAVARYPLLASVPVRSRLDANSHVDDLLA
nr:Wzz/FepE/Etk N-terminal domain-containing protein [Granulicella tundricola]